MTKPIYDASGKQKTDPQTGRPLFELVQVGTRITSNRLNTMEGGIEAAHTLVEQLAKELGGNFVALNNGTMGLKCSAQGLKASWTSGIAYVGGRRYQVAAGEMSLNPTQGQYLYVDTDGVVKKTTSQATAQKGLVFFYVATDTSGVISTTDHRVNVSLEEILKKLKDIDIEEAVTGGASGLMTGADAKFVRVDGETKTGAQEKADAVKDYVESRLDTSEYSEVTLQPGLQVIQGKRNAPFSLVGLKGRTFVNLLGRLGGMEDISQWDTYQGSVSLSKSNKVEGSNGLMIAVGSADSFATATAKQKVSVKANKFYIAVVNVLNAFASSSVFYVNGLTSSKGFYPATLNSEFELLWRAYAPTADAETDFILQVNSDAENQYAYFDAARFYEISAAEYAALDSMTPEQIAAKYPYVDSVTPVRNPYAIRYGENLLPPFYEWTSAGSINFTSPYVVELQPATAVETALWYEIELVPNTDYTLSVEENGMTISVTDGISALIVPNTADKVVTFNSKAYLKARVFVSNYSPSGPLQAGTFTFKNPMLTIGNVVKPFKPREDAMLALQTDLFADPLTGANADEVFEKDGQYFKLKKWDHIALDGEKAWVFNVNESAGVKVVYFLLSVPYNPTTWNPIGVKYDGKILARTASGPDRLNGSSEEPRLIILSISSADSGWGDAYTPTPDEIKAYFMGWRMAQNVTGFPAYNGTGTKCWYQINTRSAPQTAFPTNSYAEWTPYQLVYQLATPTVEPITSEGQLTLIEGNNQVEVGTGIVLRESIKPLFATDYYRFNDTTLAGSTLKHKLSKPMFMFRNNQLDYGWEFISDQYAYGAFKARKAPSRYDVSAAYSITYLMLDTSPAAPFVGSVAENEKALLTDMNDILRQNAAAVSVVEAAINEAVRKQNKRNVWGPIG